MKIEEEQFRRAGTQIYDSEADLFDLFLNGGFSIDDLSHFYNESELTIENVVRREFVRIRTGILKAHHATVEKAATLEKQIQELNYQKSFE